MTKQQFVSRRLMQILRVRTRHQFLSALFGRGHWPIVDTCHVPIRWQSSLVSRHTTLLT